MTDANRTTHGARPSASELEAIQRYARKLRSEAVRDAGRALGAWFKGLTSTPSGAQTSRTPRGGRTA